MGRPRGWASEQTGRPMTPSPGRPGVNQLEAKQAFWKCIAQGMESDAAALACGVSQPLGPRWFREAGGMPSIEMAPRSGRYLSFSEREELALLRAQDHGIREIARRLGRSPSTISRELRRNVATRSGTLAYRATVAQWKAERAAKRPKPAKLAENERLRTYVQNRLAGAVADSQGEPIPGPTFHGRDDGTAVGRTGAGALAGVLNRSVADCRLTILTMSLCASPTKPSIRRFTSRAVALCDENCRRVCGQAGHSMYRAPQRDNGVKAL
jgi:DNA-binding CsgD family transcriptional regulator